MIHKYDENAFLESSGIALLFNLVFSVNTFDFITTLDLEFVLHCRFSAILLMESIPKIKDVQRLQLVFKTSIQVTAITYQVAHHLIRRRVHSLSHLIVHD